jgi:hypothetical protein
MVWYSPLAVFLEASGPRGLPECPSGPDHPSTSQNHPPWHPTPLIRPQGAVGPRRREIRFLSSGPAAGVPLTPRLPEVFSRTRHRPPASSRQCLRARPRLPPPRYQMAPSWRDHPGFCGMARPRPYPAHYVRSSEVPRLNFPRTFVGSSLAPFCPAYLLFLQLGW